MSKSAFVEGVGQFEAKYYVEGLCLLPTFFTQKTFVADFIRLNLNFIHKNDKFDF